MNSREIKELVRHYNLAISPRKMGQNFLVDPRILDRIARTLEVMPGDRVLEIGAGLGALTELLIPSGATIYAVERDKRFVQVLADRFKEATNLQIIQSDILEVDISTYANGKPKSLLIAGNLPYSMTSPILEFLVRHRKWVHRAILTVQKEVAQRIVASSGSKVYSSISIFVQVAYKPTLVFSIPPNAFYPQPKVTSSVILLDSLTEAVVEEAEEEGILKLARLIFMHRRKTLLNALIIPGVGLTKEEILARLQKVKIDPTRRPETFSLPELAVLYRALQPSQAAGR